jgi:hypothetical protein
VFAIGIFRSKTVSNKKLTDEMDKIENNQAQEVKTAEVARDVSNNIHSIRI